MKGVFIVGASGAGKTTLANNLQKHFLAFFGGQTVITVNLDCANPSTGCDVDICDLVTL
jgi:adenylylsulfate kinase-like enzyme